MDSTTKTVLIVGGILVVAVGGYMLLSRPSSSDLASAGNRQLNTAAAVDDRQASAERTAWANLGTELLHLGSVAATEYGRANSGGSATGTTKSTTVEESYGMKGGESSV